MTRKSFLNVMFFLFLFTVSIALSGCSGKKDNVREEDTPKAPSDVSGEPLMGGSIVVGIQQDLDSLDPHKAVAAGTQEVLFNIFEGLVKPDKDGNLIPAVASDYKISKDGKTYIFTIRDGVKFHNGNLVTAEDIEYSIKRCAGLLEKTDPSILVESALSNIKTVRIKDQKTIELKLAEPDTELLGYLTCSIIPKDYDNQETQPIGTGPFRFVSYKPLESLVVEKNTDYYGMKKPYLDKVTFKIVANSDAAFNELKAGSIDLYPYLTDSQVQQLSKDFIIEEGNMNLVQGLFLNNKKAPFDKKEVREAMNYAVDKQGILDMVAGGRGTIIGSSMYSGHEKYYVEKLKNVYPYDPEKAKSLLNQAGYPEGFTFEITVPSNYQYHLDTAQVLVEQLKAVGITAKIKQVEWAAWLNDTYQGRNYDATIIGLDSNLSPRDMLERYGSEAHNNFINFSSQEYDKVLGEALNSIDDDEKLKDYRHLQEILAHEAASVFIQDPPLLTAVNKKLGGYTFYPVYVQDMSSIYYIEQQ